MKKKKIYLSPTFIFALLFGFLTLTSAETVDNFSADWQGSIESNGVVTAGLSVLLSQNGTSVSGRIAFGNTECGTFNNRPLTGSVSNNLIPNVVVPLLLDGN